MASCEYSVCSSLPKASTLSIATGLWSKSTGSGDHIVRITYDWWQTEGDWYTQRGARHREGLDTYLLLHHLLWAHPLPWLCRPPPRHSSLPEAQRDQCSDVITVLMAHVRASYTLVMLESPTVPLMVHNIVHVMTAADMTHRTHSDQYPTHQL